MTRTQHLPSHLSCRTPESYTCAALTGEVLRASVRHASVEVTAAGSGSALGKGRPAPSPDSIGLGQILDVVQNLNTLPLCLAIQPASFANVVSRSRLSAWPCCGRCQVGPSARPTTSPRMFAPRSAPSLDRRSTTP